MMAQNPPRTKVFISDIGRMEAARFKKELTAAIQEAVAGEEPDSPLYTYLPGLQPPVRA